MREDTGRKQVAAGAGAARAPPRCGRAAAPRLRSPTAGSTVGSPRTEDGGNTRRWRPACPSLRGRRRQAPDGGWRRRAGPAGSWGCDSRGAEGPTRAQRPGMPGTCRGAGAQGSRRSARPSMRVGVPAVSSTWAARGPWSPTPRRRLSWADSGSLFHGAGKRLFKCGRVRSAASRLGPGMNRFPQQ